MWLRIAVVLGINVAWFAMANAYVTVPFPLLLGVVGWAVLMTVIAAALWWRTRKSPERK